MTPEEKARIKIDQWFADAGWKVVNREDYEPVSYTHLTLPTILLV